MEKKVIKFNLVGAICILVLTIAIIVGLIVGIPKLINKIKDGNNNLSTQKQAVAIDESKEYMEKVKTLSGEERDCKMRYCKSKLGYAMKYDIDLFHPQVDSEENNQFISLYSNKVGIGIEKKQGKFEELEEKLKEEDKERISYEKNSKDQDNEKSKKIEEMAINTLDINGAKTIKGTVKSEEGTNQIYCIKIDDNSYYNVEVFCSKSFEDEILPVMEHMVESFEIIK